MKSDEKIYIAEDYFKHPKEQFVFLKGILDKLKRDKISLLDLGCARGEFLHFINNNFESEKLVGVDISNKMINDAKTNDQLVGIDFIESDILNFNVDYKFDFITISGLISYLKINQLEELIRNAKIHSKKQGYILLFGIFNQNDFDVIVEYRNLKESKEIKNGRNSYSTSTISELCTSLDMSLIQTERFDLSIDLKQTENTERNWTVNLEGEKMFMNGMGQIFKLFCLIIKNDK